MKYRDPATKYTDSNGFQNAMYWDILHYNNVSRELNDKKRYKAGFSYLFNFNQYIDWSTPDMLDIEIERSGEKLSFQVKPVLTRHSRVLVE